MNFIDKDDFRTAVQWLRNKRGITQATMAFTMDLSPPYLSQLENGHKNIPIKFWRRMIKDLDVTDEELDGMTDFARRSGQVLDATTLSAEDYDLVAWAVGNFSTAIRDALSELKPC